MKKQALHIVYVIYGDLGQLVGNSIHAVEITKALARQGHLVTLLIPKFGVPKEEISDKVRIITIPTLFKGALGSLIFGVLAPIYLFSLSRNCPFDLVYTMQMSFVITPLLYCLITKLPHVVEFHSIPINELKLQRTNFIKKIFKQKIVQLTTQIYCSYSDLIVVVSKHIAQFIFTTYRVPRERVAIIPNGVDIHTYQIMDKFECRKELGIKINAKVIGYIGTLYSYHRMDRIVDIAISVLSKCIDAYFIIVGNGPYLPILKQLVEKANLSDKFLFIKTVPGQLCAKYINTFDVGICLHDPNYGGFPMKLLNYLACGKPVVATHSPGTDYIAEHHLGVLINSEDPEEIAQAILQAISLNDDNFAKRARDVIVRFYSWEAKTKELVAYLQRVVLTTNIKKR